MKNIISRICGALLICVGAASCDSGESPEETGPPEVDYGGNASSGMLTVLTWQDYIVPELVYQFSEDTGIDVSVTEIENSDQMRQEIEASPGRFDVVIADDYSIQKLIAGHLLLPLEKDRISNWKNLSEEFLGEYFDPDNAYSAPYSWGVVGIAYRKDRISDPAPTWHLLWDESQRGRIGLLDEPVDLYNIALLAGGVEPAEATEEQIVEAGERLFDCVERLGGKMDSFTANLDKLVSGELTLAVTYNSDCSLAMQENPELGMVFPGEGLPSWVDSFAILRDSANYDAAHEFIDFMLEGTAAAATANDLRQATPNLAALPMIDEDLASDPTVFLPPELREICSLSSFPKSGELAVKKSTLELFQRIRVAGHAQAGGESRPEDSQEVGRLK